MWFVGTHCEIERTIRQIPTGEIFVDDGLGPLMLPGLPVRSRQAKKRARRSPTHAPRVKKC
jgi:hypothetical protein